MDFEKSKNRSVEEREKRRKIFKRENQRSKRMIIMRFENVRMANSKKKK